jgi:hypothetical protein
MTRPGPRGGSRWSWRRLISGTPTALSVIASLIAIGGLAFAIYKATTGNKDPESTPFEAKRIVAFRQLSNRICTENRVALEQALPEAHSRIQLLAFLSRGTGWGINDLESVTAPASVAEHFTEEIALRRRIRKSLLDTQRASETGELAAKSDAMARIVSAEEAATKTNRELGLRRCAPVLPVRAKKAVGID